MLLPSYREAVHRPDPLALAAPYVWPRDYPALCRVNRRCWAIFAPRLWGEVHGASSLDLDPYHHYLHSVPSTRALLASCTLYATCIADHLPDLTPLTALHRVAHGTRRLVRVLDLRGPVPDSLGPDLDLDDESPTARTLRRALPSLPRLESLLLDGRAAHIDPARLLQPQPQPQPPHPQHDEEEYRLRILSLAGCATRLPDALLASSPTLRDLVYLDLSGIPGSPLSSLVHHGRPALPLLRVLALRGRHLDDAAVGALLAAYARRLWSLDLSGNPALSDRLVHIVARNGLPTGDLRGPAHSRVEGSVAAATLGEETAPPGSPATLDHGPFLVLHESDHSAAFDHPERYLVDAPLYNPSSACRSDGSSPPRADSADACAAALRDGGPIALEDGLLPSRGLTHLHLSGTGVSAAGLQALIRLSGGHLESLSCDAPPLVPPSLPQSRTRTPLVGLLGASHLFRPAYSANLRVLRVHHSLVTNLPTLPSLESSLSGPARTLLAEQAVLPRADAAFSQTWTPDMNPRLTCLTLTGIPRSSSGALVDRLTALLDRLAAQERSVRAAAPSPGSLRAPRVLSGLRRLRLEFEAEEGEGDVDAQALLADTGFSFFDKWNEGRAEARTGAMVDEEPVRDEQGEYVEHTCHWADGTSSPVKVWIGSAHGERSEDSLPGRGRRRHIAEYRRLVLDGVTHGVGPASPCHVLAGAPGDALVFHTAWSMAVAPAEGELGRPGDGEVARMRDVLGELRGYRAWGREGRGAFWGGRLEVAT